jgi:hypothetical protein
VEKFEAGVRRTLFDGTTAVCLKSFVYSAYTLSLLIARQFRVFGGKRKSLTKELFRFDEFTLPRYPWPSIYITVNPWTL